MRTEHLPTARPGCGGPIHRTRAVWATSVATGAPVGGSALSKYSIRTSLAIEQAQVDRRQPAVDAAAHLGGDDGTGEALGQRVGHAPAPVRRHLRAAAAHRELAGVRPDDGHAATRPPVERQHAVVDQQHRALRRHLAGHRPPARVVLLRSSVADRPPAQQPDPPHQAQEVAHLPVHHRLVDRPVADGGGQRRAEPGGRARHLEVEAGERRRRRRVRAEPVRHDDAVEPPLVPQDPPDQVGLLAAVDAVDLVVGGHHGPHAGLPYGCFEGEEVDLAQGTLGDLGADRHPLVLLVVAGVVLDAAPDAARLHALARRRRRGGPSAAGPRRRTRRCARPGACARCRPSARAARGRPWSAPRRPGPRPGGRPARGSRSTRSPCRRAATGSGGR